VSKTDEEIISDEEISEFTEGDLACVQQGTASNNVIEIEPPVFPIPTIACTKSIEPATWVKMFCKYIGHKKGGPLVSRNVSFRGYLDNGGTLENFKKLEDSDPWFKLAHPLYLDVIFRKMQYESIDQSDMDFKEEAFDALQDSQEAWVYCQGRALTSTV